MGAVGGGSSPGMVSLPANVGVLWAQAQRDWLGTPRGVLGFCVISGFLS